MDKQAEGCQAVKCRRPWCRWAAGPGQVPGGRARGGSQDARPRFRAVEPADKADDPRRTPVRRAASEAFLHERAAGIYPRQDTPGGSPTLRGDIAPSPCPEVLPDLREEI